MSRIIFGQRPVQELARRGWRGVSALFLAEKGSAGEKLAQQAHQRGVEVRRVSEGELEQLCGAGANHQGVAAIGSDFAYLNLGELLDSLGERALVVVMDSVTDPHNLGAIMRSALVLGAQGLVLPKDRSAGVTPTVVRVSAGASEHLPCARVTNLARSLEQMQAEGYWVAGAVEQGGQDPATVDLSGRLALVVGSEQRGIRPLVRKRCDLLLTIPTASPIAALNVASATTALLYEISRQRRH